MQRIYSFLPLLQTLLMSVYFALGLCLNMQLHHIPGIGIRRVIHRREFVLALQVLMADIISVTCLFPVFIITRSTGLWSHLGQSGCSVFGFTQIFFTSFRYTAMFLLSFDRFNMVFFPFTYPLQGNKVTIPLTIVVWILPLLMAVIPHFVQC